jgi:hypothetical protein
MRLIEQLQQMVAANVVLPPDDPEVSEACPNLWEMITADKWGDGTTRMLPQLIIERVSGSYKVTIKDHSLCIQKSAVANRLHDCWGALEKALVDQETPWESFKSYRNKQGAKVPEQPSTSKRRRR